MITRLPPGPVDPALFFDQPKEKKYMVSQENQIDWSDARSMRMKGKQGYGRKIRYTPKFAYNDEQLRAVILAAGRKFLSGRGIIATATDWQEVNQQCTEIALRMSSEKVPPAQKNSIDKFQAAIRHCSSYLAIYAGVAFHYWRRGQDSVAVAEMLGMTPVAVRRYIHRMKQVASELGFETSTPHKAAGVIRNKKHWLEARRRTQRRKLYGKPEFDETVQCYICKVNPLAPGQKWRCEQCAKRRRQECKSARFAARRAA